MSCLFYRQNQMQEVPEGLSVLRDLRTLSLSSNEISVLPTLIPPSSSSSSSTYDKNKDTADDDDDAMDITQQDDNDEDPQTSFFKQ